MSASFCVRVSGARLNAGSSRARPEEVTPTVVRQAKLARSSRWKSGPSKP